MRPFFIAAITIGLVLISSGDTQAHMAFKKELSKKYPDMKVSCNACHVKGKPKTERGEFGKVFYKQLKDKKLTEGFKSKEGSERKKYEKEVMIPAFTEALKKIKKMKPKDKEMTYDELIKAGEIAEITKKPAK